MSGLTSYPRTSGTGGSNLIRFHRLLAQFVAGNGGNMDNEAAALIQVLTALSAQASDHALMVTYANQARNHLFAARVYGSVSQGWHKQAMEICDKHWRAQFPLAKTSLQPRIAQAIARLQTAITKNAINRAKEELGSIALLYNASTLLGQDLYSTLATNSITHGGYTESRDHGALVYLECAASYNINLMLVVTIPNSSVPLVLTGEAKGGASGYGQVHGPAHILAAHQLTAVSQRSPLYALTRSEYMAKDNKTTPGSTVRREAGHIIKQAFASNRLAYLSARGNVNNGLMTEQREVWECL